MTNQEQVRQFIEAEMVKRWPEAEGGLFTPNQVRSIAAAVAQEAVRLERAKPGEGGTE